MFRALGVSAKCCLVFASILAAWMVQWWWLSIIMAIPAFLMLLWLTLVILVFVASIFVGHFQKRCYHKPLLFWAWLPCLTLSLCLFCGFLAFFFGRYIWESSLSPYHQLGHLQAYRGIDTDIAPG